jgi:predicted transcriptional regulator
LKGEERDDENPLERVFIELENRTRLSILQKIEEKRRRLSALSSDLNLPMPEIHRNINRLTEVGLISKDSEGAFFLTPYGEAITAQISSYEFLSRHRKFFESHTFNSIPVEFIQRFGAFRNSQFYDMTEVGFSFMVSKLRELFITSNKYLCVMTPLSTNEFFELAVAQARSRDVHLRYIMPDELALGDKGNEIKKKYGFNELMGKKIIERKIGKVGLAIFLNDEVASVCFPTQKGEVDIFKTFYGNDKVFHRWALDYFEYRWEHEHELVSS